VVFLSLIRQMLREYLQIGHDHLLPNPYVFTIHYHLIQCYIISAFEEVMLNNLRLYGLHTYSINILWQSLQMSVCRGDISCFVFWEV
jgi:hypothetical protein